MGVTATVNFMEYYLKVSEYSLDKTLIIFWHTLIKLFKDETNKLSNFMVGWNLHNAMTKRTVDSIPCKRYFTSPPYSRFTSSTREPREFYRIKALLYSKLWRKFYGKWWTGNLRISVSTYILTISLISTNHSSSLLNNSSNYLTPLPYFTLISVFKLNSISSNYSTFSTTIQIQKKVSRENRWAKEKRSRQFGKEAPREETRERERQRETSLWESLVNKHVCRNTYRKKDSNKWYN